MKYVIDEGFKIKSTPELSEAMVNQDRYLRKHGKEAKGHGRWSFTTMQSGRPNEKDVLTATGKLGDVANIAQRNFKGKDIYVMESSEQIDELSIKTLSKYNNKASKDPKRAKGSNMSVRKIVRKTMRGEGRNSDLKSPELSEEKDYFIKSLDLGDVKAKFVRRGKSMSSPIFIKVTASDTGKGHEMGPYRKMDIARKELSKMHESTIIEGVDFKTPPTKLLPIIASKTKDKVAQVGVAKGENSKGVIMTDDSYGHQMVYQIGTKFLVAVKVVMTAGWSYYLFDSAASVAKGPDAAIAQGGAGTGVKNLDKIAKGLKVTMESVEQTDEGRILDKLRFKNKKAPNRGPSDYIKAGETHDIGGTKVKFTKAGNQGHIGYSWKKSNGKEGYEEYHPKSFKNHDEVKANIASEIKSQSKQRKGSIERPRGRESVEHLDEKEFKDRDIGPTGMNSKKALLGRMIGLVQDYLVDPGGDVTKKKYKYAMAVIKKIAGDKVAAEVSSDKAISKLKRLKGTARATKESVEQVNAREELSPVAIRQASKYLDKGSRFSIPSSDGKSVFTISKKLELKRQNDDAYMMDIYAKDGKKLIKNLGSHPSFAGALKYAATKGYTDRPSIHESHGYVQKQMVEMNSNKRAATLKAFSAFVVEQKDPNEYDQEGEMAENQLRTIIDAAEDLIDLFEDDDNLPEWAQNKITKAVDYLDSVRDYMLSDAEGEEDDDDEDDLDEVFNEAFGK